jgi:hypothetical protein
MFKSKYLDFWTVECWWFPFHLVFRLSFHKVCNHLLSPLTLLLILNLQLPIFIPLSSSPEYLFFLVNFHFRFFLISKISLNSMRISIYFGHRRCSSNNHHYYSHHPSMEFILLDSSFKNYRHQKNEILIMETI